MFTWTPTEAQGPGVYTFDVIVSDGSLTDTQSITITVDEVNVAPVLTNVPATVTIPEMAAYSFTFIATDSDIPAQTLTFSLGLTAPTGAAIDPSTGVFTWTPTELQGPGVYTFDVIVSDGSLTDTQSITITVDEVNVAPELTNVPATVTIPEMVAYSFTATATDEDLPANTLTFSLGVTAPAGAAIDPVTGVFTWTPTEAQGPGVYTFDVIVSDGSLTDTQSITITVDEVNVAPVLTDVPATITIPEMVAYSFTATATDEDLPTNTLTFTLGLTAPAGAAIDPVTGVFTWTPTESQGPGVYTFDVIVSDGSLTDTQSITITVDEVNVAPVLTNVPATVTIPEMAAYSFTFIATDSDIPAQTLTFSLGLTAPTGAAIDPSTGEFTWTPTELQGPGVYTFDVIVSDGSLTDTQSITITVDEVNVAPVLTNVPATVTIPEMVAYSFTATATDEDLPANTLTFSLGLTAPAGAAIDPSSGVFTWTPTESQGPGVYTFDVIVSDGSLTDTQSITITVDEVNVAPVLTNVPATVTIPEMALYTFTFIATDSDIPVQTLTFSLGLTAPTGAAIDPSTGEFTWTPTELQGPGVYTFDVIVSDGLLTDTQSITITVDEVNIAPVLADVPVSVTIPEMVAYSFTATATDEDLPANTLTFSLGLTAPTGAAIDPSQACSHGRRPKHRVPESIPLM